MIEEMQMRRVRRKRDRVTRLRVMRAGGLYHEIETRSHVHMQVGQPAKPPDDPHGAFANFFFQE